MKSSGNVAKDTPQAQSTSETRVDASKDLTAHTHTSQSPSQPATQNDARDQSKNDVKNQIREMSSRGDPEHEPGLGHIQ